LECRINLNCLTAKASKVLKKVSLNMPHPLFKTNDYVDSIESVEALIESSSTLIKDYILSLQNQIQELTAENENLKEKAR